MSEMQSWFDESSNPFATSNSNQEDSNIGNNSNNNSYQNYQSNDNNNTNDGGNVNRQFGDDWTQNNENHECLPRYDDNSGFKNDTQYNNNNNNNHNYQSRNYNDRRDRQNRNERYFHNNDNNYGRRRDNRRQGRSRGSKFFNYNKKGYQTRNRNKNNRNNNNVNNNNNNNNYGRAKYQPKKKSFETRNIDNIDNINQIQSTQYNQNQQNMNNMNNNLNNVEINDNNNLNNLDNNEEKAEISNSNANINDRNERNYQRSNQFNSKKRKEKKFVRRIVEDTIDFDDDTLDNNDNNINQNNQNNNEIDIENSNNNLNNDDSEFKRFERKYKPNKSFDNNGSNISNINNNNNLNYGEQSTHPTQSTHSSDIRSKNTRIMRYGDQTESIELSLSTMPGLSKRAQTMFEQILKGEYDCAICKSKVGKKARIWTCSHCHTLFHMNCINQWAISQERTEAETQNREIKIPRNIESIRCPTCNFEHLNTFNYDEYYCYCGKVCIDQMNSSNYLFNMPHSCGAMCGKHKSLGKECNHPCMAICHPGPCIKCQLQSKHTRKCECKKTTYKLLCGQIEKLPQLCDNKCNKLLDCKKHHCQNNCHHNQCKSCQIKYKATCFCGQKTKEIDCGQEIPITDEISNKILYYFKCGNKCNKLLDCGNHHCQFICHSGNCSKCPREITEPQSCACGKTSFHTLSNQNDNKVIKNKNKNKKKNILKQQRISCLDALPICNKKCDKLLSCQIHTCKSKCHDSPCKDCNLQITKQCRCGSETKQFKCSDYHRKKQKAIASGNPEVLVDPDSWIRCRRECGKILSCTNHKCKTRCCPGKNMIGYYAHVCQQQCGNKLNCKIHFCESRCHSGKCNECGVTYREGIQCACGSQYVPGPVRCGTIKLNCLNKCNKLLLHCDHRCNQLCHYGACPERCLEMVTKYCETHGNPIHNSRCFVTNVSCGERCNKLLSCEMHYCTKTCHNNKQESCEKCSQNCGKLLICNHKCNMKCHINNNILNNNINNKECDASLCKVQISNYCRCGNRSEKQYCEGRRKMQLKPLMCNERCKIEDRNKRFRDAFGIDSNNLQISNNKQNQSNKSNKLQTKKQQNQQSKEMQDEKIDLNIDFLQERVPYASSVLQRIVNYMGSDYSYDRMTFGKYKQLLISKNNKQTGIVKLKSKSKRNNNNNNNNNNKSNNDDDIDNIEIIVPNFIEYYENVFECFLNDNSNNLSQFSLKYPKLIDTKLIKNEVSKNSFIISNCNNEQRFMIYTMLVEYHLKYKKYKYQHNKRTSIIVEKIDNRSNIPKYFLSKALIAYQINKDKISTLEHMPPECMIVIDNICNTAITDTSSTIQDRLIAWTGDYRMWRNEKTECLNQNTNKMEYKQSLFIVFTNEKLRNSAMTEMNKLGGRIGNENDSYVAIIKEKSKKKKKNKK